MMHRCVTSINDVSIVLLLLFFCLSLFFLFVCLLFLQTLKCIARAVCRIFKLKSIYILVLAVTIILSLLFAAGQPAEHQ